jgi:hypothetical protein
MYDRIARKNAPTAFTTPVNKGDKSQYYYPKQLEIEKTFKLLKSRDPENENIKSRFIPIDAKQEVVVYGPVSGPQPGKETMPTGTQMDGGYGIHLAIDPKNVTPSSWGCPVTKSKAAVNRAAYESDAAIASRGKSEFRIKE